MPLYQPGAGVSDHGALTGLADDDHTAYSTNTEFDSHNARHYSGGDDELLLDDLGLPATNVDLNSKKLTSVLDPVDPQDAATKAYVDAASAAAHIADATDAHDASAVSFDDTGLGITAADVQTMGEQLDAAISAGGIPATVVDVKGDLIVATAADTVGRLAAGANGTRPEAASGETTGIKWSLPPGHEFDYVAFTSPVSITATTEAGADTIVTGSAIAYDGSTDIWIEFGCYISPDAATNAQVVVVLYDGASSIGLWTYVLKQGTGTFRIPCNPGRRLTPSAATHTYSVRGFVNTGTGAANVGAGGSGNDMPGFIRITKV